MQERGPCQQRRADAASPRGESLPRRPLPLLVGPAAEYGQNGLLERQQT